MPSSSSPSPDHIRFDPIEDVIEDIRQGKMVVMTDDEDRENEGDLIAAAEKITPNMVNFMARYGRGLICAPLTVDRAEELGLKIMVQQNREMYKTAFTVSVDAAADITTGISAGDRAHTLSLLANPSAGPNDFVQPGHIFPLQAKKGGTLQRAGHTEAALDLMKAAGLTPVGVICEILSEDGSMMRLPELAGFCKTHDLKLGSIASLIEHRRHKEKLVQLKEIVKMPTDYGVFDLHMYENTLNGDIHLALVKGDVTTDEPVLVRVHSECLTGDIFASRRCDCGEQLHTAMERIENEKRGVLLYMRNQEGRGIGLKAKIHAYKLQEQGRDTVEANLELGLPMDLRDYGIGAQILSDIGLHKIRLMTNNPKKIVGLGGHRLEIVEQIAIQSEPNEHNYQYLHTKHHKMGHVLKLTS